MAKRRREEFYCAPSGGGCGWYWLTYLREDHNGQFTMVCPKCNHQHFRIIKNGLVTDDRHPSRDGSCEIIIGLESTLRDTPWHNDPDFRRQQLRAYNGGVNAEF